MFQYFGKKQVATNSTEMQLESPEEQRRLDVDFTNNPT
jgi:hypothetical protein